MELKGLIVVNGFNGDLMEWLDLMVIELTTNGHLIVIEWLDLMVI